MNTFLIVVGIAFYLVGMLCYALAGPGANINNGTSPAWYKCVLWPWFFLMVDDDN